jgi:hypothetical protein
MSTYDFVINRRHNRTVDQTLTQFNQLNQNHQSKPTGLSRFIPQTVYFLITIDLI